MPKFESCKKSQQFNPISMVTEGIEEEVEVSAEVTDTQRRITEFITHLQQNLNPEPQATPHEDVNDEEEDITPILSTQEMIEDARERRPRRSKFIQCEDCEYKTSSKSILQEHMKQAHEETSALSSHCIQSHFNFLNPFLLNYFSVCTLLKI